MERQVFDPGVSKIQRCRLGGIKTVARQAADIGIRIYKDRAGLICAGCRLPFPITAGIVTNHKL